MIYITQDNRFKNDVTSYQQVISRKLIFKSSSKTDGCYATLKLWDDFKKTYTKQRVWIVRDITNGSENLKVYSIETRSKNAIKN